MDLHDFLREPKIEPKIYYILWQKQNPFSIFLIAFFLTVCEFGSCFRKLEIILVSGWFFLIFYNSETANQQHPTMWFSAPWWWYRHPPTSPGSQTQSLKSSALHATHKQQGSTHPPCDFLHHDDGISILPPLLGVRVSGWANAGDDQVECLANAGQQQVIKAETSRAKSKQTVYIQIHSILKYTQVH